jgi:hypothetical protein
VVDSVELPEGRYGGVIVCTLIGSDSADNGCSHPDWAHVDVPQQHLRYCVIFLVLLLHLKVDQYAVGEFEMRINVLDQYAVLEKTEIMKAEDVCLSLLGPDDF